MKPKPTIMDFSNPHSSMGSGERLKQLELARAEWAAETMMEAVERVEAVVEQLTTRGQPILIKPDPCANGHHDWRRPMFYETNPKIYCLRCGLETHR